MKSSFSIRILFPMGLRSAMGRLLVLVGLAASFSLAGCESYSLQGTVIEGKVAQVLVVDKSDPRLAQPGLKDARVDITLDPRALRPKKQQGTFTAEDGRFSVPINEQGAGFLEYDAALVFQREGFMHIEHTLKLPQGGKRMLVIMKPGNDNYKPDTNVVDDSVREGQRLEMLPRN